MIFPLNESESGNISLVLLNVTLSLKYLMQRKNRRLNSTKMHFSLNDKTSRKYLHCHYKTKYYIRYLEILR